MKRKINHAYRDEKTLLKRQGYTPHLGSGNRAQKEDGSCLHHIVQAKQTAGKEIVFKASETLELISHASGGRIPVLYLELNFEAGIPLTLVAIPLEYLEKFCETYKDHTQECVAGKGG